MIGSAAPQRCRAEIGDEYKKGSTLPNIRGDRSELNAEPKKQPDLRQSKKLS
jgi:hypothetical protein